MDIATARRLSDELNIEASLEYVYRFCYTADYGEAGAENELCHVFLGRVDGDVRPNDSEISRIRFVSANDVQRELDKRPEHFTPWFKQEWGELQENYGELLARYCDSR